MRLITRFLFKSVVRLGVLALAAVGAFRLYEMFGPRAQEVAGKVKGSIRREQPAMHQAADSVRNVASDAGQAVSDAARDVAQEVQSATAGGTVNPGGGSEGETSSAPGGDVLSGPRVPGPSAVR